MKRIGPYLLLGAVTAFFSIEPATRADTNAAPHFQELFRLLRANLPDVSEDDLNRAAVQGLLGQFYPRVILITNGAPETARPDGPLLSKTAVYDEAYGYLRVARVTTGLADQIKSAYEKLDVSKRLKGVVLDLRFADGQDYTAAAGAADRFLNGEQPLLDWGEGSAHSTAKEDAIRVPVTVLVNQATTGAAEALGAAMREADSAVMIGSRTAGQAQVFRQFDLENGSHLRIATGQIKVGNGKLLNGVAPDIEVAVPGEDEKGYFADEFKVIARSTARARATNAVVQAGSTNRTSRRRLNEAELVRLQREGLNPDEQEAAPLSLKPGEEALDQVVRDPALARALDLLKGIAIVKQSSSR